jgi:hypothetical protein
VTKINVYQIDEGVPIPDEPETQVDKFPLEHLQVGQSFEFPLEHRRYVQSRASTIKKRKGMEFTVRKADASSARVWRTA